MILDIMIGIAVAIIVIGGSYAYQKRSESGESLILKESYKKTVFSVLNKSLERLKGIEQLKSTASTGLQNLRTSKAGQNLDIDELKKELKKELEEEFTGEVSSRTISKKSKDNVSESVEAITRADGSRGVEGVREDPGAYEYDEDIVSTLKNLAIDEEESEDEEDYELSEDKRGEKPNPEDNDWIAELSRDIEKGGEDKVDLQRDLKNDKVSVEELEKELEDSYKKLKEFVK